MLSPRRLLVLVGAIVWVDTVFFAALTPLLPHYAHSLGLGKAGAGILQAAYPAGTFVAAVPSGIVAARLGVRRTVLVGLATLAATSAAFGFAESAWQLDAARFVQGLSSSFSWTGALAWVVAAAPASQRGRLIGTAMGLAIGGALFGPVLGGIASVVGTRAAFAGIAAIAAALFAAAARMPAPAPERPQRARALLRALRSRDVVAGVWLVMLPALLFGTLSVLAPLRLSQLGFGAIAIMATWMTSAGLEGLASPLLGRVSDRIGRLRPLLGALAAAAVVLALLPWPRTDVLLAVLVVCGGVSFGSFWTPAMALLSDAGEAAGLDHGYSFALMNLAWAPGQAVGAAVSGALAAATADSVPYLSLSCLCLATLTLLARPLRLLAAASPAGRR
jgi:MFS family permease